MSEFFVRLYKDSDHAAVRDLFAGGLQERSSVAVRSTFSLPRIWILIFGSFFILSILIGSVIISTLAVILELIGLWLLIRNIYTSSALQDDMSDVKEHYLERDGHCFWVAESSGKVVGMVAAAPSSNHRGDRLVELKRLFIAKSHRRSGIGKVLCKTVIDFARKRGCESVILETSWIRREAHRLYEKMGFQLKGTFLAPHFVAKYFNFRKFSYQYRIQTPR
ncbi:hypothetical protein GDO86_000113 [Hymenochirus boettgeri]|uniref:N-acetyltransferase domain-containing protein n=1 Tax=Hymenochirus boettgeri TaxID=247094 RepID=A0A8T2KAC6_9PIPI|nr:hypothetical protein GDO86_000113 [Hymenochirus boettgeri]